MSNFKLFEEFINENKNFPHEIKSENYWKKIINTINNPSQRKYLEDVLDTIMSTQQGKASDRQMNLLKRAESGNQTTYSTKN